MNKCKGRNKLQKKNHKRWIDFRKNLQKKCSQQQKTSLGFKAIAQRILYLFRVQIYNVTSELSVLIF